MIEHSEDRLVPGTLLTALRKVESSGGPAGLNTTNWYRNPEGPAAADKIEGLEADLRGAVQVAYRRGAKEWARLNYPGWIEWLESCDAESGEA